MRQMKSIILAAGYATRLYPLTLNQPKPLLKVAGKPMLEHILEKLNHIAELDVIYIVTNNKFFNHFNEWNKNFKSNKRIVIVNDGTISENDRLGALGDISFALKKEKINDDLIIFGGDNLFEDNLAGFYSLFKSKNASVVGFNDVKDIEIAKRMGVGLLDKDKKIIEFVEKPAEPKSTLISMLVYFLKKEDLHLIDGCLASKGNIGEVKAGELISYMIKETNVYGCILEKKWFDIGDLEQLKLADEYWRKR